jgi:hypothetical protein
MVNAACHHLQINCTYTTSMQVEEGGVHLGASVTLSKMMHAFHQLIDTLPACKVGGDCTMRACWANGVGWDAASSVCNM